MSIINDALKKAEKQKKIFSKLAELKSDAQRVVLRKWLIITGTGAACVLGVLLVMSSLRSLPHPVSLQPASPPVDTPGETAPADTAALPEFSLSGILYDEKEPFAIINDQIVAEGTLINGAELLDIQPDYARLSLGGKEFTIEVK